MREFKVNENLCLREIQLEDAADIFSTIDSQRDYLGKWLPFVALTQKQEDTLGFIKVIRNQPEAQKEFVFTIRFQDRFVGLIGFRDSDRTNGKTELGYWLSQEYQKRGFVSSSLKVLIDFAFEELLMNRIQIKCAVENLKSKRIPQNLGFEPEGIERDGELLSNGVYTDLEVYSLLKREWSLKQD